MTTLVGVRRSLLGGAVPAFALPLGDLGSGAVNTGPSIALGGTAATFTRATTAWTKLASGLWASVGSGVARSCYLGADTAAGAYGGYLQEAAGTQLVTPTASIRDMTNAAWVKTTMTTAFTSTGISGSANSCTRCTATGANSTILQTLVAAASSRTYSCWIKRITGTGEIDLAQDGATWTNITSQINSTTFTRVSLTASQLNAVFGIRIVTSGDAIDVDFNQFEAGAFATSPMDAAGAVRNQDFLSYPLASVRDSQGTCYAEVTREGVNSGFAPVVGTQSGSGAGNTYLGTLAAGNGSCIYDGATFISSGTGNSMIGSTLRRVASRWGGAAYSAYYENANKASGAYDGSFDAVSIAIGIDTTAAIYHYGTIRNVKLWYTQLTDAQIATISP